MPYTYLHREDGDLKWRQGQIELENKKLPTLDTTHDTTRDIYPWYNSVSKYNPYQVYGFYCQISYDYKLL